MKPVTDSQRLLKALNEQDQAFRKLATNPAFDSVNKINRAINDLVEGPGATARKLSEQLRTPQYQRAIDIARQLSEASSGISVPKLPAPRIEAGAGGQLGRQVRRARVARHRHRLARGELDAPAFRRRHPYAQQRFLAL